MGICFVGKKTKFETFLNKYIPQADGHFVDVHNGKEIANIKHNGVHNFTIGKRIHFHGTKESNNCRNNAFSLHYQIPSSEGLYVADIDPVSQIVYVVSLNFINFK